MHARITTPYAGHVVEVTLRSHYNTYGVFTNMTRFISSLFSGGENNVLFQMVLICDGYIMQYSPNNKS